ncbi:flagellar hook protein FlgE [Granulicella cerasi]|uniref:Flagellar hook protein FlgE n=1 Tax=Granulicella cerasi TaxID=741063 RepID=A0ABW1Z574_9BACT|nr:flagellar hook protein FlgE [Granulicella cerasi]
MGAFSVALTGLRAQNAALSTIGNNLANMNTTAYKLQNTTFADLFYQQTGSSGSGDAIQQGLGVRVSGTATDFSQGAITTTSDSSDLALEGNGFFVVNNNGTQLLTRAGDFQLSSNGTLESTDGYQVMGYAMSNGTVNSGGTLSAIQLPTGVTEPASATKNVTMTMNLNASSSTGTTFTSTVSLYDSLGNSHTATATFTKTGTNQWSYDVALPAGDATGSSNTSGTLTFDSNGNLTSPTNGVAGIAFTGMTDGASDLSFDWKMTDSAGNSLVSQSATTSAVSATTQDGYTSGSYTGFTIDAQGTVAATFSNGQTKAIASVAVAMVSDEQALTRSGNNCYQSTLASGQAVIGLASSGGRGAIEDEALESSNVDISTEFSDLIVAQRAFEANSKTVTTLDTVMQDTIGLIR